VDARQLLQQLNETDEHSQIEAKSIQVTVGRSLMETVCAFSNEPGLGGGYILLGVGPAERALFPTYEVLGISDPEKIQSEIATQCASGTFNQVVRPRITIEQLHKRNVVVAFIPEVNANDKPVFFKKDGLPRGAYRRIGPTDQQCTDEDLCAFFQGRQVETFDEQIVPEATIAHIDADALDECRRILGQTNPDAEAARLSNEDLLLSIGCAKERHGEIVPTVAGIVIFGSPSAIRRFFPMLRVDYIISPTREWLADPSKAIDNIEIQDSLIRTIVKLRKLVLGDLPTTPLVEEGDFTRKDITVLPERVLREAIVNAVMHRNYRSHQPIQVIRYPNRLEIRNPGFSLKSDDLFGKPGSQPRNPRIAFVLHELKLAETKGMGVSLMQRHMIENGLAPPYLESNRPADQFTAFFLFHHFLDDSDLKAIGRFKKLRLVDDEPRALVFAHQLGAIDVPSYRSLSGLDALSASASLRRLRVAGLLERKAAGNHIYYVPTTMLQEAWAKQPEETPEETEETPNIPDMDSALAFLDSPERPIEHGFVPLPDSIKRVVDSYPRRIGKLRMKRAILLLCGWRPLRAIEVAAYLGYKSPDYIRNAYMSQLLDDKLLSVTTESVHGPHIEYFTTRQGRAFLEK
jgi:ATP-dependent DNA helicase RecG